MKFTSIFSRITLLSAVAYAAIGGLTNDAFAQYPVKTSGCHNEWGTYKITWTTPPNKYGYAYFCMGRGSSLADGCVFGKSKGIQMKLPASLEYEQSTQYATYINQMVSYCAGKDPDSGVQAKLYMLYPKYTVDPHPPLECILKPDAFGVKQEYCTPICRTPAGYDAANGKCF